MAATNFTPILLYGSVTASNVPLAANLTTTATGVELAINANDGKLFYKDSGGTVQVMASKATGTIGGSNTQVQYNNAGVLAGDADFTFNGTTVTIANDASISGLTVGKGVGSGNPLNTALGNNGVLSVNTTGYQNTGIGSYTLATNTSGYFNTAVGSTALYLNLSGIHNTAVGAGAVYTNSTGSENTAVGYFALNLSTGSNNTAVGSTALYQNTADNNTALGYLAAGANTTGAANTAVGTQALQANTTASNNTAVGYAAGYSNTTGTQNNFFGYRAGYGITTGSYNTAIGDSAATAASGDQNTAVGHSALNSNTGATNTALGAGVLSSTLSGSNNSGAGYLALQNLTTGNYNAGFGTLAGNLITTGSYNTILGSYNGNQGGLDIRTLSNYIVLSDGDGNPRFMVDPQGNAAVGTYVWGGGNTSGMQLVGDNGSGVSFLTINHPNTVTTGNLYADFRFGGSASIGSITQSGTTAVLYNTTSDYRLKENVEPVTNALDVIEALNPVNFDWKADGRADTGFLAHEFQAVIPNAVVGEKDAVDEDGKAIHQQMDSSGAIPFLVAAIKELKAEVDSLKAQLGK